MPSVETKIWLAMRNHAEGLAEVIGLPMSWPNQTFTPPSDGYMRVSHVPNVPGRLTLGSSEPVERLGILQIMLYAKRNQNPAIAVELAGRIAAFFPMDLKMTYDGVTVKVFRPVAVGDIVPATYAEIAVNVQYRCVA